MRKTTFLTTVTYLLYGLFLILISCEEDKPKSLEIIDVTIKTNPTKTDYYIGELIDLSGLVITLNTENGDSEDINFSDFSYNEISCLPTNGSKIIEDTIKVVISHLESGMNVTQTMILIKLKDIDDNSYSVVKMGDQIWMAENLKTTRFADGTEITLIENKEWDYTMFEVSAYCYYDNSELNANIYGALYTWTAAMNGASSSNTIPSNVQGVCPDGWHLPSDNEWTELSNFLKSEGHSNEEGTVLKSKSLWYNDGNGTDVYDFNVLPAGHRSGSFKRLKQFANFWSSTKYTKYGNNNAWSPTLAYDRASFNRASYASTNLGYSIRCLQD